MTNDKPAREFWIYKGTSNFCNELWLDDNCENYIKARPEGFYDCISLADTIEGGIHVIEHSAYQALKLENERLEKELTFEGRLRNGLQEALITTLKAENAELRARENQAVYEMDKAKADRDKYLSAAESEVARLREKFEQIIREGIDTSTDGGMAFIREALNHKPKGEKE